jgi:hypothetical protein
MFLLGMHTNGPSELDGNKDAQILTMVKQIISAAFISKHVDNEVHMTIPMQTDDGHHFVPLFRLLEDKESELGIQVMVYQTVALNRCL